MKKWSTMFYSIEHYHKILYLCFIKRLLNRNKQQQQQKKEAPSEQTKNDNKFTSFHLIRYTMY